ncbi:hypothetical protein [Flavihumibacter cheonanensis]|uniref:hypothetical protein n=1 Tax=Flavihumibacter cheonanensis TaxID=1442385 RepID=UPI001EF85CC2|nr:hypothetical protein [Flavihumibacter cheonanensis]MCG7754713.1 hypothetical protein [Flavihumibacter cheonanensis]
MKITPITGRPKFFGSKMLITGVALLFLGLLGTTLIMLPLVSKQNKYCVLNTVEEEAGSNNPINEEHKNGKTFSVCNLNVCAILRTINAEDILRVVPVSENLPDDQLSQTLIQPPDQA